LDSTLYQSSYTPWCSWLCSGERQSYNNTSEFAAGLTGFFVQVKAAIDSLSGEIDIRYSLITPTGSDWATDITILYRNLRLLRIANPTLASVIANEFGPTSVWFSKLKKEFRDGEAVHRDRTTRELKIATPAHNIIIDGEEMSNYCIQILGKINQILEKCYSLM
jgi:hypothetical protein